MLSLCLLPPRAARMRDTRHYPAVTTHPTWPGPWGKTLWTPRSHPGGTIHSVLIKLVGFEQWRQRQNSRRDCPGARPHCSPNNDPLPRLHGRKTWPVYIELFWNRFGVLKLLLQNCFLVKTSPQRGKFPSENLTCLKTPSCCFRGFTVKIVLIFLSDRNKRGTWLGRGVDRHKTNAETRGTK